MHSWDTIMEYLHSVHKILDSCPSSTHTPKKKNQGTKIKFKQKEFWSILFSYISALKIVSKTWKSMSKLILINVSL